MDEEVRRRVDVREMMSDGVDHKISKWFGHVERLSGGGRLKVCKSLRLNAVGTEIGPKEARRS